MLYKTAYLKEYPLENGYIIWNGATMEFSYLNKSIYELFNTYLEGETLKDSNIEKKLLSRGLLSESSKEEQRENLIKKYNRHGKTTWKDLQIMLTDACNIDCVYCQIENNKLTKVNKFLDEAKLEKGLNIFLEQGDIEHGTVNFTGGEALLKFSLIINAVTRIKEYCEKNNKTVPRLVLNTNGTLLTDEQIRFLADNNILVIISIDGPKECHDLMRKDKQGKGTYDICITAVKRLIDSNVKVGIAAVAGKHNKGKFIEFLQLAKELGVSSIGINPPHYIINNNSDWMQDIEEYTLELIEAFFIANESGIFLEQPNRRINPVLFKQPRLRDCQSCASRLALMPDGKLAPCYTYPYVDSAELPSVDDEFDFFSSPFLKKWHSRSTLTIKKCTTCPWILICGTGCTTDALTQSDIESVDSRYCVFTEVIMNSLVDRLKDIIHYNSNEEILELQVNDIKGLTLNTKGKNGLQRSVGH